MLDAMAGRRRAVAAVLAIAAFAGTACKAVPSLCRALPSPSWSSRLLLGLSCHVCGLATGGATPVCQARLPVKSSAAVDASAVNPAAALANGPAATAATLEAPKAAPQTVYFGNGCFWGRQKEFVDTEKKLGRAPEQVSAVVGYAGGKRAGPGGKVCYYYGPSNTVYEKLGHAETVQLEVSSRGSEAEQQMAAFADTYFSQFIKTPFGMMRSDPQDAGPGYRNVVGLPGGVRSPLFKILQARNVNGMELREGDGNDGEGGVREGDKMNVVWIVDSDKLPFYRAEAYHQFHDGIGKPFAPDYKVQQRRIAEGKGRIGSTGCPEGGGFFF